MLSPHTHRVISLRVIFYFDLQLGSLTPGIKAAPVERNPFCYPCRFTWRQKMSSYLITWSWACGFLVLRRETRLLVVGEICWRINLIKHFVLITESCQPCYGLHPDSSWDVSPGQYAVLCQAPPRCLHPGKHAAPFMLVWVSCWLCISDLPIWSSYLETCGSRFLPFITQ